MNVKQAIGLMAQNPAVDFQWESTLITLINSFLPPDRQLDPHTAEATEVQAAIDSLDSSLQDMVYNSNLGLANVANPLPTSVPTVKPNKTYLLGLCAVTVCVIALMLTAQHGGGLTGPDVVEIIKLFISLVVPAPVPG